MDPDQKIAENLRRARELQLLTADRVRTGGRRRYLVMSGMVRIGLTLGMLSLLTAGILAPAWSPIDLGKSVSPGVSRLILFVPLGMIFGLAISVRLWRRFERVWFPLLPSDPLAKRDE